MRPALPSPYGSSTDLHKKETGYDDVITRALEDREEELTALIEAMAAESTECDLMLAALLEGEPEPVRIALLKKIEEMLRAREGEQEKELGKLIEKQQIQAAEQQKKRFQRWVAWIMSEETQRKIKEAFLMQPLLEARVLRIGRDMAARGVQNALTPADRASLGALSNSLTPKQRPTGRDAGQER